MSNEIHYNTEQAKKYNLTEKESIMLSAFIGELYAEENFSDVSPQDLQKITGISRNSYKGVLGSLAKKNILYIEDKKYLGTEMDIVYLTDTDLHPRWRQERIDWDEYQEAKEKGTELSYTEWCEENNKY